MAKAKVVDIYTDGGCDPNPGIGGWGAVLLYDSARKELSGGSERSTNNRMELTAVIEALKALSRPCRVRVYTDSQYVQRGISEWLPVWKRRGWKRGNHPPKNLDLWRELDALAAQHRIDWLWVPGHAGIEENERCHELAGEEIRVRKRG